MSCACPDPDLCVRLKRHMPKRLHYLYQTRADYRAMFERLAGVESTPLPDTGTMATHTPKSQTEIPEEGLGTELKILLSSLKIPACAACVERAAEMNRLGIQGCRDQRDRLIAAIRQEAGERPWGETLRAGALALLTGLAFKLDPFDPIPGLFDEALRRAEEKASPSPES